MVHPVLVLVLAAVLPRSEILWNPPLLAGNGEALGCVLDDGGLRLAPRGKALAPKGRFLSPVLPLALEASYYGFLIHVQRPEGSSLALEFRHRTPDGAWSPWRTADHFEDLSGSPETPPEKRKYLSHGPILDSKGIQAIQWRATLSSQGGQATPILRELRILYADTRKRDPTR